MLALNVLLLASAALARWTSPFPSVSKRQGSPREGIYLADCNNFRNDVNWKEIDFFTDALSGSQNLETPDDAAVFDAANSTTGCKSNDTHWIGNPHQPCVDNFQSGSGASVCWTINDDALSATTGTPIGFATNNFGTRYDCNADNYRLLYIGDNSLCFSFAYCFRAN